MFKAMCRREITEDFIKKILYFLKLASFNNKMYIWWKIVQWIFGVYSENVRFVLKIAKYTHTMGFYSTNVKKPMESRISKLDSTIVIIKMTIRFICYQNYWNNWVQTFRFIMLNSQGLKPRYRFSWLTNNIAFKQLHFQ